MHKKVVLGLTAGLFALGMWACGEGTIDAPSDKELIFVGKMSEELDAHAVDSMVALCSVKLECKQAMELAFKNDKHIREITDSTIVDENGDTTYIYSSGYLPSMSFAKDNSSSSAFIEEETISSANVSSSSRRGSGGSSEDEPVYIVSSNSTSGSGEEEGPQKQEQSSSSRTIYSSVTISSSSAKQSSSSYATLPSSSSKKVTPTSSSSAIIRSSASMENCVLEVKGSCKPKEGSEVFLDNGSAEVTWIFTPAAGSRTTGEVEWIVSALGILDESLIEVDGVYEYKARLSKTGKVSPIFSLDAELCQDFKNSNITCDAVTVKGNPITGCECDLEGETSVDLAELQDPSEGIFKWNVSKCSSKATISGYKWNLGDKSYTTASLSVNLTERDLYTPTLTVSNVDGEIMNVTCPTLKLKNSSLPIEVSTVGKEISVENGMLVKVSGAALTSGKNLVCYHGWQEPSCTMELAGSSSATSGSVGNCNGGTWGGNVKLPISSLSADGMAKVTLTNVKDNTVTCQVVSN